MCFFISCVDSGGGEAFSHPWDWVSVFARVEALDHGLQNHITGPCPSSPSRRQEENGAKVGNLPFSQGLKLHKTPSVKALIKQLLLASLCNKQLCLLRLTAAHGALSGCSVLSPKQDTYATSPMAWETLQQRGQEECRARSQGEGCRTLSSVGDRTMGTTATCTGPAQD